jgi:hypothetical protein
MKQVDPADPQYSNVIAKIRRLLSAPTSCWPTVRSRQDLAALGLSLSEALEAAGEHIDSLKPIFLLHQKTTQRDAYVLLPCCVGTRDLYVKVQLHEKEDRLWWISSHVPIHPYKTAEHGPDNKPASATAEPADAKESGE